MVACVRREVLPAAGRQQHSPRSSSFSARIEARTGEVDAAWSRRARDPLHLDWYRRSDRHAATEEDRVDRVRYTTGPCVNGSGDDRASDSRCEADDRPGPNSATNNRGGDDDAADNRAARSRTDYADDGSRTATSADHGPPYDTASGDRAADHGETVSAPAQSSQSVSQQNAARSAKSYLDMTAFSRTGLIKQLEYEKFSTADATFGADSLNADWSAQAARSAKVYLEMTSFSHSGLVDQLVYDGFTPQQAEYGVSANHL
jgi:hypothetical protein